MTETTPQEVRKLWKRMKEAGGILAGIFEFLDFIQDTRLITMFKDTTVQDLTKVKINKRRTKREYGQAVAQLTQEERDSIMEIHDRLRVQPQILENFVLNASLTGESVADTVALLKMLAQLSPDEAAQLIDDMDLEKAPVHKADEYLQQLKQLAMELDAQAMSFSHHLDDENAMILADFHRRENAGFIKRLISSVSRAASMPWEYQAPRRATRIAPDGQPYTDYRPFGRRLS